MKGVEDEPEDIAVRGHEVALKANRDRLPWCRVVVDAGDVQVVGIVQHAHVGAERGREPRLGELLHEI